MRNYWMQVGLFLCLLSWSSLSMAERLPVKSYTSADGLAQNNVNRLIFDSHGFLWICTNEGLSRFDGYKFNNFGTEQGLPHRNVNDLLETRTGEYWLATNGGLVRFNPQGVPGKPGAAASVAADEMMFRVFAPRGLQEQGAFFATSLLEDRRGVIWCGSKAGLLRLQRNGQSIEMLPTELWQPETKEFTIETLMEDRQGVIWAGSFGKIYRLLPEGKIERYTQRDGLPDIEIHKLYEDRQGNVWAATGKGLLEIVRNPEVGKPLINRLLTASNGLAGDGVRDIWQSAEGEYWVATDRGLVNFTLPATGQPLKLQVFTKENGLSDYYIKQVVGDRYGNLWVGTPNAGILKLFIEGFTTIGYEDGLMAVVSAIQSKAGERYFLGYVTGNKLNDLSRELLSKPTALYWRLGHFNGQHFTWVRPNVPREIQFSVGWNQVSFQDSRGEWWIATSNGLYRFPRVNRVEDLARVAPKKVYTTEHGLTSNNIYRLFEDSHGDIWISTSAPQLNGIHKWERATERIINLTQAKGLPSLRILDAISYAEDRTGAVWVGFGGLGSRGALARYRQGTFTTFAPIQGAPASNVIELFLDNAGKLWIGTNINGLFRVDHPEQETPVFFNYTTAQGLSSNRVTCITEDQQNRVYIGTGRGVDRLDQQTGNIRHFTQTDGLPLGGIDDVLRDQAGNLWFATTQGLARFIPRSARTYVPPPILIDNLRVRGVRYPLSALGATTVSLPELKTEDNHVGIEFVGLSMASGDILQYQYKLEGVDADWGPSTLQRSINYASLVPGDYRFLVRAINADGMMSAEPASLRFTILRPLWQRWWFLSLLALTVSGMIWVAYRSRVAQLIALERVRTRIAADLHDDIGANLTRISILSEIAKQQNGTPVTEQTLNSIADIARESVTSMSDIVWAINPERDNLLDLTRRMRQLAEEVCTTRDIQLQFNAPDFPPEVKLNVNVRRDLYLIFKEALNNAARHALCTNIEVYVKLADTQLHLTVSDNGRGFEPAQASEGNGLHSMSNRAKAMGGEVKIESSVGQGTCVRLHLPLAQISAA